MYLSCGIPCCRLAPESLQALLLMQIHGKERSFEGCLVFINILCPEKSLSCNLWEEENLERKCLMYLLCSLTVPKYQDLVSASHLAIGY